MRGGWVFLALFTCLALTSAHLPGLGSCPQGPYKRSLSPARLVGTWYEQMRYYEPAYQTRCTTLKLAAGRGGQILATETQVRSPLGDVYEKTDKLQLRDPTQVNGLLTSGSLEYMVIDTDYTKYTVLALCKQMIPSFHVRELQILTRERQPKDRNMLRRLLEQLQKKGVYTDPLVETPHINCGSA